jgi:ABC-type sugar transport system ATPase subunit
MADVQLVGVTKRFGAVTAVDEVDLQIADGEFVTLLGPSGCGKTTTLNMIAGLEEVSAGEIRMGGRVVNDLSPFERDVAMVFQNYALYPHMTVGENIGFTLRLRKRPRAEIQGRVGRVADMLELGQLLDRLPRELSGGQQQRVALGRAVIREPAVFLFDEPFSNLDAALRIKMRGEIKELHQRLGVTSVFVTHDQEEALSISDRIAVYRAGRIEQVGTPEDVYARPASRYVARFIGSPQMDILAGDLVGAAVGVAGGAPGYRLGSAVFAVPPGLDVEGPVDMGIRPEHVHLGGEGVPARVRIVQPIGPATHVTVEWDGGTATARVGGIGRLAPDDPIHVSFDPAGMVFFDRETGRRIEVGGPEHG